MIKVESAFEKIIKNVRVLDCESIKLTDAPQRVLAEDIYAGVNIPTFNNSAMDGYALKARDTKGASKKSPKVLEVIYALQAGDAPKKALKKGQAVRIMTGALLPKGADSVIMVEDTRKISHFEEAKGRRRNLEAISKRLLSPRFARGRNDTVEILKEVAFGENIRKTGEDIKRSELVIKRGAFLNSGYIGILAALGRAKVKVTRRPKVAILATGNEVIDVDKKLKPGKLRSSNTYTLYSQVRKSGGIPKNLGIARDNFNDLEKKIKEGLDCDLILTSGGVSVGDYDLVKDVLAKMGTDLKFWKVAMRPGKPLAFGTIKGIPVFGLPGNPVSSMISFEIFVRPAISKMLGQKTDYRNEVDAVLQENITKKRGLRYFLRAVTCWKGGYYLTRTTGPQGSGILKSMALANSLIILPEDIENIKKGSIVRVKFLD